VRGPLQCEVRQSDVLPRDATRQPARFRVFEGRRSRQLVRDGVAHEELGVMAGEIEVDGPLRVWVTEADHVGRIVRGRDVIERTDRSTDTDCERATLVVDHGEGRMARFGPRSDAVEQQGQIGMAGHRERLAMLLPFDRHGVCHACVLPPPNDFAAERLR
jgi:hypothetical protein